MKKFTLAVLFLIYSIIGNAQPFWIQKNDYAGGSVISPCSFTIDNYAYVGTGKDAGSYKKSLYRYDSTKDIWKRMADLPASSSNRKRAVGFSINGKGYITGGCAETGYAGDTYPVDMWEYDPSENKWIQKSSFPRPGGMDNGTAFSIGNYGYAGLGYITYSSLHPEWGEQNSFYKYDPKLDRWFQINDFPGAPRQGAVGFSINGKGYIGLGYNNISGRKFFNDIWEYDPVTDDWDRVGYFPGELREYPIGFGVDGCLYFGMGKIATFYKYDLKTKEWSELDYIPNGEREGAMSFCVNNSIFIGAGISSYGVKTDLWEYKIGIASNATNIDILFLNI